MSQYQIPIKEYKSFWETDLNTQKVIRASYKHLFKGTSFYSLPELYSPTMVAKNRHTDFNKPLAIQMKIQHIQECYSTTKGRENNFTCILDSYCKKWGLDNLLFKNYLKKHIFGCMVKGNMLTFSLATNPFHAFILLPYLYSQNYRYEDLLACFSHKPTVFLSDYYSFYDYRTMSGDKGKAVTLTAIYNMFDYNGLVELGFPMNSKEIKVHNFYLGQETLSVLFLGYFHPERNNSIFYLDYAWDISIIDEIKKKLPIQRTNDFINKIKYTLDNGYKSDRDFPRNSKRST